MAGLDPRQKAVRISDLFRARQPVAVLPDDLRPADLDEAYTLRRAFEAIETARGRGAVAGYKVGLTTPVMQRLCGVDEPCYGAIFAGEVHHSPADLALTAYCRLGVETEIAFRLADDLPDGRDRARVADAVQDAMAAIELIEDLRFDYQRQDAAAMVAGNVWNAGIVLGPPVAAWSALDLTQVVARLSVNGREIGTGRGEAVMGNPLNALAWLADKRAAEGTPLTRGTIVMTGSMVPIHFPSAGQRIEVSVSGLGRVELGVR